MQVRSLFPSIGKRAVDKREVAPLFYLHLISDKRRLSLGPLSHVGGGPDGALLAVPKKSGKNRYVRVYIAQDLSLRYDGVWYPEWAISPEEISHPEEIVEAPRAFRGGAGVGR